MPVFSLILGKPHKIYIPIQKKILVSQDKKNLASKYALKNEVSEKAHFIGSFSISNVKFRLVYVYDKQISIIKFIQIYFNKN